MRHLLFCLFLLTGYGIRAQPAIQVTGSVRDPDGQSLAGASVQVMDGPGTVTGPDGRFRMTVPPADSLKIQVRYLGYSLWSGIHSGQADAMFDVVLEPEAFGLQAVELIGTWADRDAPFTEAQMDAGDLEKQNLGQDMPYLLRYLPGVVATSDAGTGIGYTGIRIRGSDPTRTNITINGIPVNDAESQAVFWVNMPDLVSSVDRVQVQRGVGTSTNGAGAFGATINLQTRTLRPEAYGEVSTSTGSFGTGRVTAGLGTGLLAGHWSLDGRFSAMTSDGYIDRATARLWSGYGTLTWQGHGTLVRLLAFSGRERTYQSWWGTPRSRIENDEAAMLVHAANNGLTEEQTRNLLESGRTYNYYQYKDEVDQYGQDNLQLQFSRSLGKAWRMNLTGHWTGGRGYFEQYRGQDDLSAYGLPPVVAGGDTFSVTDLVRRRWLDNDFAGAIANVRWETPNWNLHAGGGWNVYLGNHFGRIIWAQLAQGLVPDQTYYQGDSRKTDGNLFVRADHRLGQDWRAFADLQVRKVGYRTSGTDNDLRPYDVRDDLTFFNPKVGLTWSPKEHLGIYASLAIGHREPSRSDYVDAPSGAFPRPERMTDLESGIRWAIGAWSVDLNGYWMAYTDQLVPTGALNDVGATLKVNVPDSWRAGLEARVSGEIGAGFTYGGNLGLSRNRIRAFEEVVYDYTQGVEEVRIPHQDVEIAYSPTVVYSHQIGWTGLGGLSATWFSQAVSRQFLDNTGNPDRALDGWWIQDLQVAWQRRVPGLGDLQCRVQVNNVLDRLYSSNGYTYTYRYGGEITEVFEYPQAGRHWAAGLTLKW